MDKFTLIKEETVLMVIDIQERLAPAIRNHEEVINNTNILITIAKELNIPILATEQYPRGLGDTVPEISSNLDKELIYEKISFTGCTTEVIGKFNSLNKKKIIITGMEAHVCVFQTVRDLIGRGYQVFVVEDAVSSRTKGNYKNALALMSSMGAVVTNTETILFDLMKEAGTPLFKKISQLIK